MTASGREPEGGHRPGPGPGLRPGPHRRPGTGPLIALAAVCAALFAAAAVTVSVRHGAPLAPERGAVHWTTAHHGEPLRSLARALTATGTGVIPYAMAVLAGLLAGRSALGRLRAVTCAVAVLAVGQAIRYGLMELLARPRPPAADWAGHASGYAFPSGHATTSALAAGLLAWGIAQRARPSVARTWCAVLALWAAGVGLTRVYLGVHWPGDVLGGWLLAAALLALALLLEPFALRRPDRS
ncbi:PAP2 family protein [Streptomyces inhibens]|uniref:PAP2 family protein n=1 Tax=Streptomyces inhibens TaxID=2293571 RepID=A0A371Q8C8_STRIH|nr:phosphatase PAP2 family protein [Streptomyces inhibens]REK90941.1 PAP2 family protein [Streptomyces inhibens]